MIKPIPGIDYAALVMTGQKPFPTFNKERKGEGFKEALDKAMEDKPWMKENAKNASTTS